MAGSQSDVIEAISSAAEPGIPRGGLVWEETLLLHSWPQLGPSQGWHPAQES